MPEFLKKTMEELERIPPEKNAEKPKKNILLLLENIRSMHNVGAAFRTADALSIESIYLIGFTPTPPHRDIRKTALGAEETVNWLHFENSEMAIDHAKTKGYKVYAVEQVHNSTHLYNLNANIEEGIALLFGNEVVGVSDNALKMVDECIEIPQEGSKHSLNISISLGIVLWEIVRKSYLK